MGRDTLFLLSESQMPSQRFRKVPRGWRVAR